MGDSEQALILEKGNLRAGVGRMKTDGQTWSPRSQWHWEQSHSLTWANAQLPPTELALEGGSQQDRTTAKAWGSSQGPSCLCLVIIKAALKTKGPRRILKSDWIFQWRPESLNFYNPSHIGAIGEPGGPKEVNFTLLLVPFILCIQSK